MIKPSKFFLKNLTEIKKIKGNQKNEGVFSSVKEELIFSYLFIFNCKIFNQSLNFLLKLINLRFYFNLANANFKINTNLRQ